MWCDMCLYASLVHLLFCHMFNSRTDQLIFEHKFIVMRHLIWLSRGWTLFLYRTWMDVLDCLRWFSCFCAYLFPLVFQVYIEQCGSVFLIPLPHDIWSWVFMILSRHRAVIALHDLGVGYPFFPRAPKLLHKRKSWVMGLNGSRIRTGRDLVELQIGPL
jgi:hypothetical protein